MPERRERNPLSQRVIRHLQTVAGEPVVITDPRHGAVHGTSLQTIRTMVESGVVVGYSHKRPTNNFSFGDIAVYPTTRLSNAISHLTDPSIRHGMEVEPEAILTSAQNYAKTIARRHEFLEALGLSLNDGTASIAAEQVVAYHDFEEEWFKRARNYFRRRRFSSEEIDAAFHHALQRKGFLVGLSPYIAFTQGITLNNGDLGSSDVRVNTDGEGLPYQLVSGIQPLGPIEEKYLRRLFVYSRT